MKRKRRTLKTKYKIVFSSIALLIFLLLTLIIFSNNNKTTGNLKIEKATDSRKREELKTDEVTTVENEEKTVEVEDNNEVKNNVNEISNFDYPSSWYTNGVLDPQKVSAKAGMNLDNDLTLINKIYQVDASYVPDVYPIDGGYLRQGAKDAYIKMKNQAANEGVYLTIGSSYRSYGYQETVFNGYLANDSYSTVLSYSAYPGTSEHQSGLVIDFVEGSSCDYTECFKDTASGNWLKNNAYKYGFILRYPKGKENITGYIFEPWHYRYVGVENATKIHNSGITLEEYLLS